MNMNRRKFISHASKLASAVSVYRAFPEFSRLSVPWQTTPAKSATNSARPQLALTMDDPTLKLNSNLRWPDANARILKAIGPRNVRTALFV